MQAKLVHFLNQLDLVVKEEGQELLLSYIQLLNKWNKTYNLTAVRDPEQMLTKHIIDSLAVAPYLQGQSFADLGSGAGLPGIPLAIYFPEKKFYLIESQNKRIQFLKTVVRELKLSNIEVIGDRAENVQLTEPVDGVLSRAVAELKSLIAWSKHLTQTKSRFYALKGTDPKNELIQIPSDLHLIDKIQLKIPNIDAQRHLIILGYSHNINELESPTIT